MSGSKLSSSVKPDSRSGASSTLDVDTLSPGSGEKLQQVMERVPTLTIAYHPSALRIGEQARLGGQAPLWHAEISRLNPDFSDAGGHLTGPLRHRFVSRTPLTLTVTTKVVRVSGSQAMKIDGHASSGVSEVPLLHLERGIVLELSGGVILVLGLQRPAVPPRLNLSGVSDAIGLVRDEIERVAPQETSVLIQGETGVGKELIARALHQCSRRAQRHFVSVNMGAIPKETAAAELFGYKKGAFTGAVADHPGYFGMAEGGTLFLDEIGETPPQVQPILLRALENQEIQPLGAGKVKQCDVRVFAATDANLMNLVERGTFRKALLHRLAGYQLKVPPLRERKEDIAVLFVEFLRQELERAGSSGLLSSERAESWLRSRIVTQLLAHAWPGNVRELRNAASQLVAFSASLSRSEFPPALAALGKVAGDPASVHSEPPEPDTNPYDTEATAPPPRGSDHPRRPADISDGQLVAALKGHSWQIASTARALGIARNSLYELIERCPKIRKARDLEEDEIQKAHKRHTGHLKDMARELQVSLRALQLRMKELGLK